MDKTRVKTSEKGVKPDNKEVICPLVLLVTGGESAVNYDLTWSPTIKLGDNEPGAWRSAPQQRGHADAFYAKLKDLKERGLVKWEEDAFYFTHDDGKKANAKYIKLVLEGKSKANKKSWTNRYAEVTGKSFDELKDEFPELYATATTSKKESAEPEEQEIKEIDSSPALSLDELEDASDEDLQEIEAETLAESEEAEAETEPADAVHSATATESSVDLDLLDDDVTEDVDERNVIRLRLSGYDTPEMGRGRLSEDCFIRSISGDDMTFYEVELPEVDAVMFVTANQTLRLADEDGAVFTYEFIGEDD